MQPIEFPEQTVVLAKDQPEYLPLPAYMDGRETISCWKLTLLERLKLLFGRPLWLRQMNFGDALQPQLPTLDYPFLPKKERQKRELEFARAEGAEAFRLGKTLDANPYEGGKAIMWVKGWQEGKEWWEFIAS